MRIYSVEPTQCFGMSLSKLSTNYILETNSITRCAVHYQDSVASKHEDALYQRLRQADVHLSDCITSTTRILLNEITIASASIRSNLHLEDDGSRISLYVPRKPKDRELSYLLKVPERFVSYFEIKDREAVKVFGDVLKSSLSVLDYVLESHGIVRVPGIVAESLAEDEAYSPITSPSRESAITERVTEEASSSDTEVEELVSSQTSITEVRSERAQASFVRAARRNRVQVLAEDVSQAREDHATEKYRALLDHVIKSAQGTRSLADLPAEAFVPDDVFGIRATNQLLHDMKIGAAGELYVGVSALICGLC